MSQEKQLELDEKKNGPLQNEDLASLEDRFLKLSEEYKIEKEAYDMEVLETETKIEELKKEIAQLEKQEILERELEETKKIQSENIETTASQEENEPKTEEIIENAIDALTPGERKILETEMNNSDLLPNESKKTKTNINTFLQNQMVKYLSDIKIPDKLKNTVRKSMKYFLAFGVVSTLWANDLNPKHEKLDNLDNKNNIDVPVNNNKIEAKSNTYFAFAKTESGEYKALPSGVQEVYSYAMENIHDNYIVIDKPSAEMYVFNSSNELITSLPVLLGKDKGEEPNRADTSSPIASHATTPAGKYQLGKIGITDIGRPDSITYQGRIISLLGSDNLALHRTYPGEYVERTKALNTSTVEDNRKSWGCINISPENFDKYIKPYFNKGNQNLFITPDNPSLSISPINGKIKKVGDPEIFSFKDTFSQNI